MRETARAPWILVLLVALGSAGLSLVLSEWWLVAGAVVIAVTAVVQIGRVLASESADSRDRASQATEEHSAHPHVLRQPVALTPLAVLSALSDSVAEIADPVGASLWLFDESTGTLRQVAATGVMAPSSQPVPLEGDDVVARASATGAAVFDHVARVRSSGESVTLSRFAIPLEAGESRGVAAVELRGEVDALSADLPVITAPLRSALGAALALHVANTELETSRALQEVARDLSRILDEREVIATALGRAMAISAAATGSVMLLNHTGGRLTIALAKGLTDEVVQTTSLGEGEGIAGWVLATGQPLLVEDLPARTPAARRHGIRSAISVPISDDDGTLGVLNVGSRSFPARFTQSHMDALAMLGKQCATALRNARAVSESRAVYFDTLKALALALETKDPYSRGGTERVLEVADSLAGSFDLPDDEREALRVAALLHDIGMTAAGDGVLTSDRTLTTVERALLKMHPQIAAEILAEAPALRRVVPIVYHHHEWYDGGGYLGGLSGQMIPFGARILAVADAYVAMTSDRPYRRAMSPTDAVREMTDKAGTQFDPSVVDALRDILRRGSDRVPGSNV